MSTASEEHEEQLQQDAPPNGGGHEARIRLGERLSQARQARDITIREASDRLKIRIAYLEGLESGDWAKLPEEVYVMGFLRQYAALLGVDLSDEIEALKTGEYQLTKPFTMPDPPIAMSRSWALAAGAVFLLLLVLFNVIDEGEEDVKQTPPASVPLASSPATPDNVASPKAEPPAQAAVTPEAAAQSEQPPASADKAPAADTTEATAAPQAAPATSTVSESEQAATPASAQTAPEGSHHYRLTAVGEDVWLQLHTPDGKLLKEALLRSGQSMRLDSDADYLLLTAGNPLALSIVIDDASIAEAGSLGKQGKVLRDYRLQPARSGSSR